jgi:hypothetical protein
VICFSTSDGSEGLNFRRTYGEVEAIIDYYNAWTVDYAMSLTVRERRHWFNRVRVKVENMNIRSNQ